MRITKVDIKFANDANHRFIGYVKLTLDDVLVIHDVKIIDGASGLFVGMPTHRVTCRCPFCTHKNHVRSNYCNECGKLLPKISLEFIKYYYDVAHPINHEFRVYLEDCVLSEYDALMAMQRVDEFHAHDNNDKVEIIDQEDSQ